MAANNGNPYIKHIDGKWRIMDHTGEAILHAGNNPSNKPADGGGYASYEEALNQFHAMMRSMHGG